MSTAVDRLIIGTIAVMHEVALLGTEVSALRKANEGLSKRQRAKKKRAYGLEDHLQYKKHKIYWIKRLYHGPPPYGSPHPMGQQKNSPPTKNPPSSSLWISANFEAICKPK